jgi:hypothetical protein
MDVYGDCLAAARENYTADLRSLTENLRMNSTMRKIINNKISSRFRWRREAWPFSLGNSYTKAREIPPMFLDTLTHGT